MTHVDKVKKKIKTFDVDEIVPFSKVKIEDISYTLAIY